MKIFVVENEELIRKGILKYIERGKRGDEIVGEARDGESAYPMMGGWLTVMCCSWSRIF